jgi:hypothetical protein
MIKTLMAAFIGCVLLFGQQTSAFAGAFELFADDISTSCDEHAEPCRHNDLGYQTRYRLGPYLRYGIKTSPARYAWRHERIMVLPPRIVPVGRAYRTHKINGERLVRIRTAGHYKVVAPARYATVVRRVLVAPARNRVVRLKPTHAYLADTIIVKGGGCKRPLTWYNCY